MDKELDESFIGAIIFKNNYSPTNRQLSSTSISAGLILASALNDCGYDILEIHFYKKEEKNG